MKLFKNNQIITEGFEFLDLSKKSIFISNHPSKDDVSILSNLLPSKVFFALHNAEKDLYKDIIKNRNHIFYNHDDSKSLSKLNDLLNKGTPILIFPEAKVSHMGSVIKIYDEISNFIRNTDSTVNPISIMGTENENYFPYPHIKVVLEKPFPAETTDTKKITKLFQDIRLKHANKSNVNLYNELLKVSKKIGDKKIILEDLNSKMTYKNLLMAINVFHHKLKPLLDTEKRIGIFLPTSSANTLTLFSLFQLGKTPALLNFSMGEQALIDCVETADLKVIITSKVFIKAGELEDTINKISKHCNILYLEDIKNSVTATDKLKGFSDYTLLRKADEGDKEIILFTSGSESKPKGVILTHDNLFSNIQQALSVIDIKTNDRMFSAMPAFHSFGLTVGTLLPILTGMYTFMYPSPLHHKMIPNLVYQKEATIMFGTSTFFSMYEKSAHDCDLNTIRIAIVGAEKLKEDVSRSWFDRFGIRIFEGYGVTETSPVISLNTPTAYKKNSVGRLLPGIDYKIEPVDGIEKGGNLFVKGPNIMKGYLIHNKGFVPLEEWHETGDIVDMDENGFINIVARLKRFAKIGGEMISLNFIEELASQCFEEQGFASVSIPDKKKGEKVILFTTNENIAEKDFKRFIKAHKHSSLLIPKEFKYIESIPLLGTGKTDYVSLQQLAQDNQ